MFIEKHVTFKPNPWKHSKGVVSLEHDKDNDGCVAQCRSAGNEYLATWPHSGATTWRTAYVCGLRVIATRICAGNTVLLPAILRHSYRKDKFKVRPPADSHEIIFLCSKTSGKLPSIVLRKGTSAATIEPLIIRNIAKSIIRNGKLITNELELIT